MIRIAPLLCCHSFHLVAFSRSWSRTFGHRSDGKRKGRKKTTESVWAVLGIGEDEWLHNSCFLFSSHFSSTKCLVGLMGRCVWDAIPLVSGQVFETSPSSWCFYCETSTHRRFILATLETKAPNNDIHMWSFVLKEFIVTLQLIKKSV